MSGLKKIPQYKPRLSWKEVGEIPAAVPVGFYPERSDNPSDFEIKFLIAKGDHPMTGTDRTATPEEKIKLAREIVLPRLTPDYVNKVYDSVVANLGKRDKSKPVAVHMPLSIRDTWLDVTDTKLMSTNMISIVFALELTRLFNEKSQKQGDNITFANDRKVIRITKDQQFNVLGRANADMIGRFVKQTRYEGDQIQKGDLVVMTDDHLHNGAVMKSMIDAVTRSEGKILGIATFGGMPESVRLKPPYDVRAFMTKVLKFSGENVNEDAVAKKYAKTLDDTLYALGLSLDSLTTRETLALSAILLDGKKPEQLALFNEYCQKAGVDPKIIESVRDSIKLQIMEPPLTPVTFHQKITERIEEMLEEAKAQAQHAK